MSPQLSVTNWKLKTPTAYGAGVYGITQLTRWLREILICKMFLRLKCMQWSRVFWAPNTQLNTHRDTSVCGGVVKQPGIIVLNVKPCAFKLFGCSYQQTTQRRSFTEAKTTCTAAVSGRLINCNYPDTKCAAGRNTTFKCVLWALNGAHDAQLDQSASGHLFHAVRPKKRYKIQSFDS